MLGFTAQTDYNDFFDCLCNVAQMLQWDVFPRMFSAETVEKSNDTYHHANKKFKFVGGHVVTTFLRTAFGLALVPRTGQGKATAFEKVSSMLLLCLS